MAEVGESCKVTGLVQAIQFKAVSVRIGQGTDAKGDIPDGMAAKHKF